ncbi:MAG: ribosomal protein S12 methylthiotransferase RimO [Candidatus Firestonebacteria bacterium RIFOXYA2_FULL_40_8]|nr:MAG: ribosomal protein S12 methylthiotransferase RimO [Candidatus Firestonebacteria bacterium RIFOXYA2_FULL_40_8]
MPTVSVISLGCAKNLVDTEVMLGSLRKSGFEIANEQGIADVILINTCSFLSDSRKEAGAEIRLAVKNRKKGAVVAVAGCFVGSHGGELKKLFPKVDIFLSFSDIPEAGKICLAALSKGGKVKTEKDDKTFIYNSKMPRALATLPHYAYVKISDGCDNCCAYCLIPSIRGHFRSRKMEDIVAEVKTLALLGVKEINLISQDTTRYGEDIYCKPELPNLLKQLSKIKGIAWIRLLYLYPSRITDELLNTMSSLEKVVPYFDIPLQHTESRILKLMGRFYDKEDIEALLLKIRKKIPEAVIRTTLIAGFPGETKEEFLSMLKFLQKNKFDKLGVFEYSREKGTPAYSLTDSINSSEKTRRKNKLMKAQKKVSLQLNKGKIGSKIQVLTDTIENSTATGRSLADAPDVDGRIYYYVPENVEAGDIVTVKVKKALPYDLIGEAVGYKV